MGKFYEFYGFISFGCQRSNVLMMTCIWIVFIYQILKRWYIVIIDYSEVNVHEPVNFVVCLSSMKHPCLWRKLAVCFDMSTSRMSKIFGSLIPLIAPHMTKLIVWQIIWELAGIWPEVLKWILKILCAL